ncbi:hypothetical protein L2E82_47341 [Cichorium intybus]|uniref:Uncharacterized protein n=1 Tax=Cichorium intybus TaxID=13427 RepID=A0ACB8YWG4_CICIN|nr:hypothetical protein L2E82_47341 [Cichorium intybus]
MELITDTITVQIGSTSTQIRVKEIEGRLFQNSVTGNENDYSNPNEDDEDDDAEESEDGDFITSSDDDSSEMGSTGENEDQSCSMIVKDSIQLPSPQKVACGTMENDGDEVNEKKEHKNKVSSPTINLIKISNTEYLENPNENHPNTDPTQNGLKKSPTIGGNNNDFRPTESISTYETLADYSLNHMEKSPRSINEMSTKLKALLSRQTPIKDKLKELNSEVYPTVEIQKSTPMMAHYEGSRGNPNQIITRSRSRNQFLNDTNSDSECYSSNSLEMSFSINQRLEEVGMKSGLRRGKDKVNVTGSKAKSGDAKGNI